MGFDTSALANGPAAFAAANGLGYAPVGTASHFGGAVFEYLQGSSTYEVYRSTSGRLFEVGTISGRVGGGQTREEGGWTVRISYDTSARRTYGYIAIQLERAVPQLVLDAKRNGDSIPMAIGGGQTLSLEGDFDQHFTLYAPQGYERDALYIMTPDLMALLIDETGDLDVEVVDDMLFVYATAPFDTRSAAVWERIGRIRDVVGAKAIRQTDYYRDDRQAGNAASPIGVQGHRLRLGLFGSKSHKTMLIVIVSVALGVLVVGFGTVITVFIVLLNSMPGLGR
jgi:hypothetical protein